MCFLVQYLFWVWYMQSEAFRFDKSFEHSPKPSKRQTYIRFHDPNVNKMSYSKKNRQSILTAVKIPKKCAEFKIQVRCAWNRDAMIRCGLHGYECQSRVSASLSSALSLAWERDPPRLGSSINVPIKMGPARRGTARSYGRVWHGLRSITLALYFLRLFVQHF